MAYQIALVAIERRNFVCHLVDIGKRQLAIFIRRHDRAQLGLAGEILALDPEAAHLQRRLVLEREWRLDQPRQHGRCRRLRQRSSPPGLVGLPDGVADALLRNWWALRQSRGCCAEHGRQAGAAGDECAPIFIAAIPYWRPCTGDLALLGFLARRTLRSAVLQIEALTVDVDGPDGGAEIAASTAAALPGPRRRGEPAAPSLLLNLDIVFDGLEIVFDSRGARRRRPPSSPPGEGGRWRRQRRGLRIGGPNHIGRRGRLLRHGGLCLSGGCGRSFGLHIMIGAVGDRACEGNAKSACE